MLKVRRIRPSAVIPTVVHPGEDLGYDLYAAENALLLPSTVQKIHTGIAAVFTCRENLRCVPYGLLIRDRSSMAGKGIITSGGVIDASYRGEIIVLLTNMTGNVVFVKTGDKIAQMIPVRVRTNAGVQEVDELPEGTRGAAGFGSSGR